MNEISSKFLTILVIDDNPLELGLIRLVIQKNFTYVKILSLTKPPDWETFLKNQSIDVIIVDYRLPEKNGLSVIQEIRKYDSEIPAFLITALERDEIDQDVTKSGATDFIVKDRNYSNLVSKLNDVLLKRTVKEYRQKILSFADIIKNFTELVVFQIDYDEKCIDVLGTSLKDFGINKENLLGDVWKKYFYEAFKTILVYFNENNEEIFPFNKFSIKLDNSFIGLFVGCLKKQSNYYLIVKKPS